MMVVSNTLLRNQSTSQKGQSLPFPLVAGRSNGCFDMVQQPWFLVSQTYVANALYNHLPHQVKKERHYKAHTRTSAQSRVSPRAARSSEVYNPGGREKGSIVNSCWKPKGVYYGREGGDSGSIA